MFERIEIGLNGLIAYFSSMQLLFAFIIGLSCAAFITAIFSIVSNITNPVRKQLRDLGYSQNGGKNPRRRDWLSRCVMPFRRILIPQSEKEVEETRRKLAMAGLARDSDLVFFYMSKMGLALGLGVLALVLTTFKPELNTIEVIFFVCLAVAVGIAIPNIRLRQKIDARKERIVHGFPDMLDLMVACTEAGLGLNAAIQRVSKEIHVTHPDLARELKAVNSDILGGVDRIEALKGLSRRTEISEISGFVSMLVQSVRFGTGIAETLRVYADEFRDKRMQKAEEAAEKIGTKLLFPLVVCMFPSFFVVAVGPAAIAIMKAFGSD